MSEENEDINEALEQLRRLSANQELVDLMDRQDRYESDRKAELDFAIDEGREIGIKEGMKEGRKEGIEQGEKKNKIETAKKMFKKNMPLELIMEITELSEKEIIQLK